MPVCKLVSVQAAAPAAEAEAQTTEVVGIQAHWLRFFRRSRRHAFLRRLRSSLVEFTRTHEDLFLNRAQRELR